VHGDEKSDQHWVARPGIGDYEMYPTRSRPYSEELLKTPGDESWTRRATYEFRVRIRVCIAPATPVTIVGRWNMPPKAFSTAGAVVLALGFVAGHEPVVSAQGVEVTPLIGYRFGGDFFELITRHPVDLDGARAVGLVTNVPLSNGLQVEGLATREQADILAPHAPLAPAVPVRMTVDHWLGGGLQEFEAGAARPFLTGMLGLTRYAAENDSEMRFTLSAGGGVKLFPTGHVGLRLESRVFTTFVDAHGSAFACSPGVCLFALHTNVVWQAEFTAGVVFKLR
jgi:hypothetical protein